MHSKIPDIDAFVDRAKNWQQEIRLLRSILLNCGLDEALKWGKPCYMHEGKNIAIIQAFKAHCSLMFFKGALLKDKYGLLKTQGPNTQFNLRLEFTQCEQIKEAEIKYYVKQAVEVEKSGLQVDFKAKREIELPAELVKILEENKELSTSFFALTPGRQRAYILYFAGAKQSKTRITRIEKWIPRILAGKGMNDRD